MMGYEDTYVHQTDIKPESKAMEEYNMDSLKKSQLALDAEEITSIFINYPPLLLRKKSMLYPEGRTTYRFKRALRRKVTIIDRNDPNKNN